MVMCAPQDMSLHAYLPGAAGLRRWSPSAQTGCVRAAAGAFPSRPASPGGSPHTSPASRGTPFQLNSKPLATPFHPRSLQKVILCASALQSLSHSLVCGRTSPEHLDRQRSTVPQVPLTHTLMWGMDTSKGLAMQPVQSVLLTIYKAHDGSTLCDVGCQE